MNVVSIDWNVRSTSKTNTSDSRLISYEWCTIGIRDCRKPKERKRIKESQIAAAIYATDYITSLHEYGIHTYDVYITKEQKERKKNFRKLHTIPIG